MFLSLFCVCSVWSIDFEDTKKLAEQGNSNSQYNLGYMYYNGEGIPQDYKKARYWFTKSAEQGNPDAQHKIGYMYHLGKGVSQDYKKALYWYKKSAKQGFSNSQYNIGYMYYNGEGIPQDYKIAYIWFSLAAAQGHKKAIYNRDMISKKLSSKQLGEAQELSSKTQYKIDNPTQKTLLKYSIKPIVR